MRKELIERLQKVADTLSLAGLAVTPDLLRQAADMLEADAPAVPQEPVRNDMSIQLLERLIKTLTNLGYATPEGGIEAFNADLPTQLYHLCFGVDHVLSALKTAVPQEPVAIIRCWTKNGEGHSELVDWCCPGIESLPDGEHKLFAAPQQRPRLTEREIFEALDSDVDDIATAKNDQESWDVIMTMARAIEKKVRGEA